MTDTKDNPFFKIGALMGETNTKNIELQKKLTQTQQALDSAVKALKFYADDKNRTAELGGCIPNMTYVPNKLTVDNGTIAKAVLASIKE